MLKEFGCSIYFFSQFIYPGQGKHTDVRQVDGQYEVFTAVEKITKKNLAKVLTADSSTVTKESLLAGAIAMALCYISRLQRTKPPGATVIYYFLIQHICIIYLVLPFSN